MVRAPGLTSVRFSGEQPSSAADAADEPDATAEAALEAAVDAAVDPAADDAAAAAEVGAAAEDDEDAEGSCAHATSIRPEAARARAGIRARRAGRPDMWVLSFEPTSVASARSSSQTPSGPDYPPISIGKGLIRPAASTPTTARAAEPSHKAV
jgi:hypothetical protein